MGWSCVARSQLCQSRAVVAASEQVSVPVKVGRGDGAGAGHDLAQRRRVAVLVEVESSGEPFAGGLVVAVDECGEAGSAASAAQVGDLVVGRPAAGVGRCSCRASTVR